jgi:hypothetical protein
MSRGYAVNIPVGIGARTMASANLYPMTSMNYAHMDNGYLNSFPVDNGARIGFVLINKGWSNLVNFPYTENVFNGIYSLDQPIPWYNLRNLCRFSQHSLNCYDGYLGTEVNAPVHDKSHFAVVSTSVAGPTGRAMSVFAVEDLPHQLAGTPGWERSDKDFNDLVFGLQYVKSVAAV